MRLALLVAVLFFLACNQRGTTRPDSFKQKNSKILDQPTEKEECKPVAYVDDTPVCSRLVKEIQTRANLKPQQALNKAIDAIVVAQEAKRNGFEKKEGETIYDYADRYLSVLYPAKVVCKQITDFELKIAFELAYKPNWLVDSYECEVIEVSCCGPTKDCGTPKAQRCLHQIFDLYPLFEKIASAWRTEPDKVKQIEEKIKTFMSGFRHRKVTFNVYPNKSIFYQGDDVSIGPAGLFQVVHMLEGEVSDPIISKYGIHVIKLLRARDALTLANPKVRQGLFDALCRKTVDETRKNYVQTLRSYHRIRLLGFGQ